MVVIRFVDDEGNLGCIGRTLCHELSELDGGIITHDACQHIGTRFGLRVIEAAETGYSTRLVEGGIAVLFTPALCDLFRVIHIERIGKTVVCFPNFRFRIPRVRFIMRFVACYR